MKNEGKKIPGTGNSMCKAPGVKKSMGGWGPQNSTKAKITGMESVMGG